MSSSEIPVASLDSVAQTLLQQWHKTLEHRSRYFFLKHTKPARNKYLGLISGLLRNVPVHEVLSTNSFFYASGGVLDVNELKQFLKQRSRFFQSTENGNTNGPSHQTHPSSSKTSEAAEETQGASSGPTSVSDDDFQDDCLLASCVPFLTVDGEAFNYKLVKEMCLDAEQVLAAEPVVVPVNVSKEEKLVLVGDVHGQFRDLQESILKPQWSREQDNNSALMKRQTQNGKEKDQNGGFEVGKMKTKIGGGSDGQQNKTTSESHNTPTSYSTTTPENTSSSSASSSSLLAPSTTSVSAAAAAAASSLETSQPQSSLSASFPPLFHDPRDCKFLFLGDYVDRGPQGVEILLLLLALKIEYPSSFFLLRGNHEEVQVCRIYGFFQECRMKLDVGSWTLLTQLFTFLPLAATVESQRGTFFTCHGGLNPLTNSVETLQFLNRQEYACGCLSGEDTEIVDGLLWSDPADHEGFCHNARGCGFTFGADATRQFCLVNGLQFVVRAHQLVLNGYEWSHDNLLLTLFSAPNYCGINQNLGAIAILDGAKQSLKKEEEEKEEKSFFACNNSSTTSPELLKKKQEEDIPPRTHLDFQVYDVVSDAKPCTIFYDPFVLTQMEKEMDTSTVRGPLPEYFKD